MQDNEFIKVSALVSDVKYDFMSNHIFIRLDVNGTQKAVEITPESVIHFKADDQTVRQIMQAYADAWNKRKEKKLPLILELTKAQLYGSEKINI